MALSADRIPTLFDEVVRDTQAPIVGTSVVDDLVPNRPLLGPSIGDDGAPQLSSLGASIGDDLAISDRRLKTNIEAVGSTVLGLPLYRYSYVGQVGVYEGVMAQDVLAVMPEAVSVASDGFYRVNYARLGATFRRIG